ncbi:hypothetical protein ACRS6B_19090 [Nocardia asteroides]
MIEHGSLTIAAQQAGGHAGAQAIPIGDPEGDHRLRRVDGLARPRADAVFAQQTDELDEPVGHRVGDFGLRRTASFRRTHARPLIEGGQMAVASIAAATISARSAGRGRT